VRGRKERNSRTSHHLVTNNEPAPLGERTDATHRVLSRKICLRSEGQRHETRWPEHGKRETRLGSHHV
jgi:hypothetical protein